MPEQSVKLCECGCGEPAPIAARTSSRDGWVRGQPKRFRAGHQARVPLRWIAEDHGYDTPCWVYQGPLERGGYGQRICRNGVRLTAHRFSWVAAHGAIPEGLSVLHHCDNPPCVRPDHLFLGTIQDNHDDQVAKGRQLSGERHPRARLTKADVDAIRRSDAPTQDLAKHYGVSGTHIRRIKGGQAWFMSEDSTPPAM